MRTTRESTFPLGLPKPAQNHTDHEADCHTTTCESASLATCKGCRTDVLARNMGRVPWNQRAVCPTRFAVWRRAKNHICKKCLRLPSASVFILDVVSKEAYTRIPNGPHVATPPMHETVMPRITLPSAAFSDGTWWAKQGNVLYQILREQPTKWQQEGDGSLVTPNRDLDAGRLIYGVFFFCCSCANQHRSRIGGSCTVTRSKLQRLAAVFEEPKYTPPSPHPLFSVYLFNVYLFNVYMCHAWFCKCQWT